eukprot:6473802-Amphidinium_carterae.2
MPIKDPKRDTQSPGAGRTKKSTRCQQKTPLHKMHRPGAGHAARAHHALSRLFAMAVHISLYH